MHLIFGFCCKVMGFRHLSKLHPITLKSLKSNQKHLETKCVPFLNKMFNIYSCKHSCNEHNLTLRAFCWTHHHIFWQSNMFVSLSYPLKGDKIESFRIGNTDIKCENTVTLLGIILILCWKLMTMWLIFVKKRHQTVSCYKKIGQFFLTKQGKLVIHNYFISSNVSYCSLAWHFYSATSTNIQYKRYKIKLWGSSILTTHSILVSYSAKQKLNLSMSKGLSWWQVRRSKV